MTEIDTSKLKPAMVQYANIKNQYKDFLVFWRMGDFYELFFDDALIASKALDITLTRRSKSESQNIPMCGVPFHAYENYMARLIHQGYKVAICEQVETPEEAKKRGSKELVRREVVRLVTPGTLTEDNLLDARTSNYLLTVARTPEGFAFAWLELSTGDFYTQFLADRATENAANLQSILHKLDPGEIVVSDALLQNPKLFEVFNAFRDRLSVLPQARFNNLNAHKRLLDTFKVAALDALGSFTAAEVTAAGVILDYVENTQKGKLPRLKRPIRVNTIRCMEIDAATRNNLELLKGISGDKRSGLLSVIDRTITGPGARLLGYRLQNPSVDLIEINRRLDMIDFFITIPQIRSELRACFKDVADIERIISRLSLGRGGPRELAALGQTLACLPKIRNILYAFGRYNSVLDQLPPAIDNVIKNFGEFGTMVANLSEALEDIDHLPLLTRDGGFIRHGYSPALDEIKNVHKTNEQAIAQLAEKYINMTGIPNLRISHNNIIGYYVEFPAKNSKDLLQNPFFIFRQSVLNAARFTTVELNELEDNLRQAGDRALALELEIYDQLVETVLRLSDDLSTTAYALAELDIAAALAELAADKNYCRPQLDETLSFNIQEGRHPVVEAALEKAHEGQFIGNDCQLDGNTDRIWLLTGPNMAGKSTFLRQNAIIAIMAQMGSYVPCKSAHLGLIDKVFSRVGASDDLSRGRSTFMVEMVETSAILNQATPRSFVILDEIGRGTATYDGLSIAWAVVENLHEINRCRALFATHYHELTVLNDKLDALSLHCMKIKEFKGDVIFMHEVINGAADRSYGIHVAKLAGLPDLVVKRADQILHALESNPERRCVSSIEDDLPLFAAFKNAHQQTRQQQSPLQEALKELNPDNLSPREALEKLYALKQLYLQEND